MKKSIWNDLNALIKLRYVTVALAVALTVVSVFTWQWSKRIENRKASELSGIVEESSSGSISVSSSVSSNAESNASTSQVRPPESDASSENSDAASSSTATTLSGSSSSSSLDDSSSSNSVAASSSSESSSSNADSNSLGSENITASSNGDASTSSYSVVASADEDTTASNSEKLTRTTLNGEFSDGASEAAKEKVLIRNLKSTSRAAFALLLLDIAAFITVTFRIKTLKSQSVPIPDRPQPTQKSETMRSSLQNTQFTQQIPKSISTISDGVQIGKLHNIGHRPSQQDSFAVTPTDGGALAVVADGMGGLSGGDQVSQLVVRTMLSCLNNVKPQQMDGVLYWMLQNVVGEVNKMLGAENLYKSGSTLVAVLIKQQRFHWISVGDSRIYLYRNGCLLQLNREHTYEQELWQKVVNGEIDFETLMHDKDKSRLTSFIGMGALKYVDGSRRSIALRHGDRLLLMSDGVFNAVSEIDMVTILQDYADIQQAASELEKRVLAAGNPNQDNFTAVILGI